MSRRFPRSVYDHGEEPDPRFSLANERTFLAAIRTALAFIAGGIALEALATTLPGPVRLSASLVLIALGLALPVQAWRAWTRAERALRTGRPLPAPSLALPIAAGVVLVALLIGGGVLVQAAA
jgi:putative membrane protein